MNHLVACAALQIGQFDSQAISTVVDANLKLVRGSVCNTVEQI